ncbi:MAG TPA: hypothetical protein VMT30_07065 [Candidatus Saccharimonadia bacterium]|nr:hypothetical protein [Candidatus Saccharimonadia bacterium]
MPLIPRTYEHGTVVVAEHPKPSTCRFELAPTGEKPHHWTDVLSGGTCQSLRVGSHYKLKTGWNFTIFHTSERIEGT